VAGEEQATGEFTPSVAACPRTRPSLWVCGAAQDIENTLLVLPASLGPCRRRAIPRVVSRRLDRGHGSRASLASLLEGINAGICSNRLLAYYSCTHQRWRIYLSGRTQRRRVQSTSPCRCTPRVCPRVHTTPLQLLILSVCGLRCADERARARFGTFRRSAWSTRLSSRPHPLAIDRLSQYPQPTEHTQRCTPPRSQAIPPSSAPSAPTPDVPLTTRKEKEEKSVSTHPQI
jgi:hypothetical protein